MAFTSSSHFSMKAITGQQERGMLDTEVVVPTSAVKANVKDIKEI
jgi:hypothetical protein